MKNKYVKRSKISASKFREIIRYYALDLSATKIAILSKVSRNTINRYLIEMRKIIYEYCSNIQEIECGEIEIDESYFGAKRKRKKRGKRGKRGRGASNKTIVFGLLQRKGKVYTHIVPDASADSLIPIIRQQANEQVEINSDGWKGYNSLVDVGYQKHYRVYHGENEFAKGKNHINGIESFWGYAKHRLMQFKGVKKELFKLHLKECEYRFNLRGENVYKEMLKLFRDHPLFVKERKVAIL